MNEPRRSPAKRLLAAGVALALAVLVTAGFKSWNDLVETRDREQELELKIVEAERRIDALVDHVRRLEDDPVALERAAREQLGFVRPEDLVIVLPRDERRPTPPAAAGAGPPR